MTNNELLKNTDHRPWPLPTQQWKFYQEWNNALFLHWVVDASLLNELVPNTLELDTFEGKAWISLVAFTMEHIRPRLLPAFSPISNFDEINIRTYVKGNGKSGVYFLSIEAGKRVSAWIAKSLSGLPYRYSSILRTSTSYNSSNDEFSDRLSIDFEISDPKSDKTELDKWLTERYALFQDSTTGMYNFEIHHCEWPIDNIQINKLTCDYPRFARLLSGSPNLAHWSRGVKVLAWYKEKLNTSNLKNL
jgi:hypothetical protein